MKQYEKELIEKSWAPEVDTLGDGYLAVYYNL